MKKLRKFFTISVMLVTVLSMSVVVAPDAGAAASAGDLIKMDGLASVYYLADDNKRYVFPNESTYFSWYSDWSGVVTVPQSELEGYPLGANVTVRPGTKLVKITTNPTVYAVEPSGMLRSIVSEANAISLFGEDWATRVIDVPDAFFTNYETGAALTEGMYPIGSLVKTADSADVYYYDGTDYRMFGGEAAMTANRFSMDNVLTAPDTLTITAGGTNITAAEGTLIDTSSGAGGTPVDPIAGTGLTVSLSSGNPGAANIPAGSPNPFLELNLTASSDGDVSVSTITLSAYDLGTATNVDSVTFYDDGVKVGTAKNINSDRVATFNFSTPIEVAAGTTKTLMVKATIASGTTGNYALGIASASGVTTDGAAVSGTFPVRGNTQAIVSGVTIGTVTMSTVGTSDTTNNFGEDNVLLASFNLAAANEAILWSSMRLKNGGTNTAGIVGNMRVEIDGDEVVGGAEIVDRFVNFDLANYRIAKNDTVSVEIYGDLGIANTSNTVDLYFDDANDLVFLGESFGYGVQVAAAGFASLDAVSDGIVVTLAAGDVTIDMNKTATPSRDVRPDDNDVVLATISMVSAGENATITAIGAGDDTFYLSGTGIFADEFENVELRDTDTGAIYDLAHATSSGTTSYVALTLSDEISLVQGVTKTFELRADLLGPNDTNGIDNNDTLQATLAGTGFTITGDTSDANLQSLITPSSVLGAIMTVKTASLTWQTTSLTNKTIVGGSSDVVIYRAGVEAGASSDVTITSVKLSATSSVISAFQDTNVSQLRLYIDGKLAKTSSSDIVEQGGTDPSSYINFTSLATDARTIPAGQAVVVEVKADFAGTFNPSGWIELEINSATADIVAKDVDNNNVAESVANVGTKSRRVILASTGTLKVELLTTDSKANTNSLILAGGTKTSGDKYVAQLKMTTANEEIKVKTLVIGSVGTARDDDVAAVVLYGDDEVEIARKAMDVNGRANFDALDLVLDADTTNKYYLGVVTNSINASGDAGGAADDGDTVRLYVATSTDLTALGLTANKAVTAVGNESGNDITCVAATSATVATGEYADGTFATSTTQTIRGTILTSITNMLDDGTLTAGNNKIVGKYKFVFDNGSNRIATATDAILAQMITMAVTFATSSNVSVANVQVYNEIDDSTKTTAVEDIAGVATANLLTLTSDTENVDGTVTLVVEADISGTLTSGDYVQTSLADLSSSSFIYTGFGESASAPVTDLLINKSEVQGGTLTN